MRGGPISRDSLADVRRGTPAAQEALLEATYAELRRIAAALMRRERPGHTLQPTELVHSAWFKLVDQARVAWTDRAHFLNIAGRAMRQVLVDHARRRGAVKRAAGRPTGHLRRRSRPRRGGQRRRPGPARRARAIRGPRSPSRTGGGSARLRRHERRRSRPRARGLASHGGARLDGRAAVARPRTEGDRPWSLSASRSSSACSSPSKKCPPPSGPPISTWPVPATQRCGRRWSRCWRTRSRASCGRGGWRPGWRRSWPTAAPPSVGTSGPYRLVEVLGEGGMGVVYRAEQTDARSSAKSL